MSNYVNNKELYKSICDWKEKVRNSPGVRVPQNNTIGRAIMLIAEGLSKKSNFSGYTQAWREEMIADGVEAAIKGLHNFDETKYNNPHAYITAACWNAFVQRIKKEQKEQTKKYRYFVHNVYDSRDGDMVALADEAFIQDIHNKITHYENSATKTPRSDKKSDDAVVEGAELEFLYQTQN